MNSMLSVTKKQKSSVKKKIKHKMVNFTASSTDKIQYEKSQQHLQKFLNKFFCHI